MWVLIALLAVVLVAVGLGPGEAKEVDAPGPIEVRLVTGLCQRIDYPERNESFISCEDGFERWVPFEPAPAPNE